jgi:hypothetical protein
MLQQPTLRTRVQSAAGGKKESVDRQTEYDSLAAIRAAGDNLVDLITRVKHSIRKV